MVPHRYADIRRGVQSGRPLRMPFACLRIEHQHAHTPCGPEYPNRDLWTTLRRQIERAACGTAERAERQQRRVADAQRIVTGRNWVAAGDVGDRLIDAQGDAARLVVHPPEWRERRIDTSVDIALKHAVAIAVRKQPELRAVTKHFQAHRNRSRALERLKTRA